MRSTKILTVAAMFAASGIGGWAAQSLTGAAGAGFAPRPEGYNPRGQPTRITDTRNTGIVGAGATIQVNTGQSGVQAVAVNIALTETAGPGFVTAWDCGTRPSTSVINSTQAGENISNFVIVPVNSSGIFCLYANSPTHIVVDLMGTFTPDTGGGGNTFPATPGLSAQITGYAPRSTYTLVSGVASNNSGATKSFRVDIRCPNGTTETDSQFSVPNGSTVGFEVLCEGGGFTTGASVLQVVQT